MKKYVLAFILVAAACDIPVPDSGCAKVTKTGNVVHVEYCDGGVAGAAGQATGSVAGHDHGAAGMSGSMAGQSGAAGHVHPEAGASGDGSAGSAGMPVHMHGGLPVTLPLPAPKAGRTDQVLVSAGTRKPTRDAGEIGAARTRCYASFFSFDDPIVFPGQPGLAHLHMFYGADKADSNGVVAGAGGTCRGGAVNLSAYWAPALLDAQGNVLVPYVLDPYYKQGNYDIAGPPTNFVAPPKGLKLIAGDMTATKAAPQDKRIMSWSCEGPDTSNGNGQYSSIPSGCTTPAMHVHFPFCWDGVNLDSPTHRTHLVYPSGNKCPASNPVLIPAISVHIYYKNVQPGAHLSCDADVNQAGACGHADEIINWDETIMSSLVKNCVNAGLSCGSDLTGDGRSMDSFGGN